MSDLTPGTLHTLVANPAPTGRAGTALTEVARDRHPSQHLLPRRILGAVLAAASALVLLAPSQSSAYPPTPPSAGEAAAMLEGLSVKAEGSTSGYSRDLFPHWIIQSGNCDTREATLYCR